ncbi:MAG: patatin-like phospholipase family protein [Myxococcota bacterium]|nr:patatin-like phospholipase family protein [Myxococcota bacterium]
MGLTLIRKSRGAQPKRDAKVALVLAGGAVSGGAFKVGGLKALDDFLVDRKMVEFDTYVGLSAGSILAVALAAGVSPNEMVKVLEGHSRRMNQLRPIDFYNPNFREFVSRPAKLVYDLLSYLPGVWLDVLRALPELPDVIGVELREFVRKPDYTHAEAVALKLLEHVSPSREIPGLTNHIPSGFFDSAGLERWLRKNLERMRMPNDFQRFEKKRGRSLYITACDLDTADRVTFGPDEVSDVTISQAVQASTALPIFYRPARIRGVDYVDGGVRRTANIDVAIEKGADLIICYNPFRPFLNRIDAEGGETHYFANGRYLSDRGLKMVLNQVFRTLLHSRLKLGLQRYLTDERFQGDIILLEPRERDAEFFNVNPLAFWKRSDAIQHGFESVRTTIEQNFDVLADVLGRYGLAMSRDTARRRADRVRVERGWNAEGKGAAPAPASAASSSRTPLRVVGSDRG